MKNDYIYAVARIRVLEMALLSRQDLEQLMGAADLSQALQRLKELGWGGDAREPEEILRIEEDKIWRCMEEILTDPSVLDPLKYPNDYHNVKAAVKLCCTGTSLPPERFLVRGGTIPWEQVLACVRESDYEGLPKDMARAAREGYETLLHTGDGQLSDAIVDRHFLEAFYHQCKNSPDEVLRQYGTAFVVFANLRIAMRSCATGRPLSFLEHALAPIKELDRDTLAYAAVGGLDQIADYVEHTSFSSGAQAIKTSPAAFEKWCSDAIMDIIRPEKFNPSTAGPLIAYVLARENEIKYVRLILSVKQNGLPQDLIRERLGDMYV